MVSNQIVIQDHQKEQIARAIYTIRQSKASLFGLSVIGIISLVAVFGSFLVPHPEMVYGTNFASAAQPPSFTHPMGTDQAGRDILSRVILGTRTSLMVGLTVVTVAGTMGVSYGLVAGYASGNVQSVLMRIIDIFLAVPPLVLALSVIAVLGPSLFNAIIAICFSWWAWYARLVSGEVLSAKEDEFVETSRAIGSRWTRTIFKEILPNVSGPILVKVTLDMGLAILVAATLGFLGLGAQPPAPEWGVMIADGRDYMNTAWWYPTFPGVAIAITVLGFNMLGDGLRDVLDVEVETVE